MQHIWDLWLNYPAVAFNGYDPVAFWKLIPPLHRSTSHYVGVNCTFFFIYYRLKGLFPHSWEDIKPEINFSQMRLSVKLWPDLTWTLDLTPLHNADLRAGHDLMHQTIAPLTVCLEVNIRTSINQWNLDLVIMPGSSASEYLIYSYKRVPWERERLTTSIGWHSAWKCLIFAHILCLFVAIIPVSYYS